MLQFALNRFRHYFHSSRCEPIQIMTLTRNVLSVCDTVLGTLVLFVLCLKTHLRFLLPSTQPSFSNFVLWRSLEMEFNEIHYSATKCVKAALNSQSINEATAELY
jgi:hypothetical protein